MAAAIASFQMPEVACLPHAPGLIERMAFILQHLDASAARPGVLEPAIDASAVLAGNASTGSHSDPTGRHPTTSFLRGAYGDAKMLQPGQTSTGPTRVDHPTGS